VLIIYVMIIGDIRREQGEGEEVQRGSIVREGNRGRVQKGQEPKKRG
jgi:hypothetical protein